MESGSKSVKRLDSQGAALTANLHLQWNWDRGAGPPWLCRTSPTYALFAGVGDVSLVVAKPANCRAFFRKVVFPCSPFLGFWKFVWESAEVGFNRSQELAVATITIHFTLGPSETPKMAKFILDIPRVLSREIAVESSNERLSRLSTSLPLASFRPFLLLQQPRPP